MYMYTRVYAVNYMYYIHNAHMCVYAGFLEGDNIIEKHGRQQKAKMI